jgi:hypothetical protein
MFRPSSDVYGEIYEKLRDEEKWPVDKIEDFMQLVTEYGWSEVDEDRLEEGLDEKYI